MQHHEKAHHQKEAGAMEHDDWDEEYMSSEGDFEAGEDDEV